MHYSLPGKHFPCSGGTIWDLFPQLSINLGSAPRLDIELSRSLPENRRIPGTQYNTHAAFDETTEGR